MLNLHLPNKNRFLEHTLFLSLYANTTISMCILLRSLCLRALFQFPYLQIVFCRKAFAQIKAQ